jgi:hypothetical protein
VAKGFGEVVRPISGDVGALAEKGKLAALLCRLARDRFTGVVYAQREDSGAVFSFRDGRAVFVEDLGEAQTIPDMLLERGLVTSKQYAEIATRVVVSLAEDEDVAFCQQAVQAKILTQAQLDAELQRRVRGRVIQAIAWEECKIEIDDDPDALAGILEYPQAVGPLVYMGVRTFYDEERVRETLGADGELYVRLNCPVSDATELFGLEQEEVELLSGLRSDLAIAEVIHASNADPLEAWQLLCMLALAGMTEISGSPLSAAERSGVRSTRAITGDQSGTEAAANPRFGSQPRMPVPRDERNASQPHMPIMREQQDPSSPRMPAVRERGDSQQRLPSASERGASASPERTAPQRSVHTSTRYSSATMNAIREEQISRAPSTPLQRPRTPVAPTAEQHRAEPKPQPRPVERESTPNAQQVAPQAAPRRDRNRPRKLSATLKRLDQEFKQLRQPLSVALDTSTPPPQPAPSKGHIEQLRRMRQATISVQVQQKSETESGRARGAELFRSAQDAMRDQQFGRAHDIMRKASEADPGNEIYTIYGMWASFRCNTLAEEGLNKLRQTLREKVSDDELKAFAYYALGHIALVDKKDDTAEKCFRKAVEFDKNNKDAERHVRIIELRRKSAAEHEKSGKFFGIDIKAKKS